MQTHYLFPIETTVTNMAGFRMYRCDECESPIHAIHRQVILCQHCYDEKIRRLADCDRLNAALADAAKECGLLKTENEQLKAAMDTPGLEKCAADLIAVAKAMAVSQAEVERLERNNESLTIRLAAAIQSKGKTQ